MNKILKTFMIALNLFVLYAAIGFVLISLNINAAITGIIIGTMAILINPTIIKIVHSKWPIIDK
jgi:hypothetical protein